MFPAKGAGLFYKLTVTSERVISIAAVLNTNKVSKSEKTRKVKHAHHFLKVC